MRTYKVKMILVTISAFITLLFSVVCNAADNKVPYPTGYRNWTHVKSMVIKPGHPLENPFQGIHHIYANKKALQALWMGIFQMDPSWSSTCFVTLKKIKRSRKPIENWWRDA